MPYRWFRGDANVPRHHNASWHINKTAMTKITIIIIIKKLYTKYDIRQMKPIKVKEIR